ncbi:MAG: acyl-CoA thioesterase [Planctomycetota bacterium]
MTSRTVHDSKVEMTEIVLPNDTNQLGNCMGGRVMHLMDICCAIAARRHARTTCVTAAVDQINFVQPVPMGSVLILKASVNYAGRSSMEIGVRVETESTRSGERSHCASAYMTFVALDEDKKPMPVPKLVPETENEIRRHDKAVERRQRRLQQR